MAGGGSGAWWGAVPSDFQASTYLSGVTILIGGRFSSCGVFPVVLSKGDVEATINRF